MEVADDRSNTSDCEAGFCTVAGNPLLSPYPTTAALVSLTPYLVTFAAVSAFAARSLFPRLSRANDRRDDGDDHYLPVSAPSSLRHAHAEHAGRAAGGGRRRRMVATTAFSTTLGLAAVLAELILAEVAGGGSRAGISSLSSTSSVTRASALRFTVSALLVLLVIVVPFLEIWSLVFATTVVRRRPRLAWAVQLVLMTVWLCAFWSLGRVVPSVIDESDYLYGRHGMNSGQQQLQQEPPALDNTGLTIGRAAARAESFADAVAAGTLGRACLQRVGAFGIALMALLSGFASVSTPWHALDDRYAGTRRRRRRPITDADVARRQAALDATADMRRTKELRLRALQEQVGGGSDNAGTDGGGGGGWSAGRMLGSLKSIATGGRGNSVTAEIKSLQLEIDGLATMEATLASSVAALRARKAAQARDGTVLGWLFGLGRAAFALYCAYRVVATALSAVRRAVLPVAAAWSSSSAFGASDPISRLLVLLAHRGRGTAATTEEERAWAARQAGFLVSGAMLAASAGSAAQTARLFARWAPEVVLRQARANLALAAGQVAGTYAIGGALLLRGSLPREVVGGSVADALEGGLEPGFVDRWFEAWFLIASTATAAGIWLGRKMGGGGMGGGYGGDERDEWDEYEDEEMGQKLS